MSEDARAVFDYTDEVKEELKEKGARKVFTLSDIRLYECPLSFLSEDTRDLMRLAFLVDDTKRLLYAGGWGDQPYWLIEAYEILKTESIRNAPKGSDNGE